MTQPTLQDRIAGCLIGSAVGDALGAPTECMHYQDIHDQFGDFKGFEDLRSAGVPDEKLGRVTDDTVLSDLLLDCIIRHGGTIDAHVFAAEWERFEMPVDNPNGDPVVRLDRMHWIERIPYLRNRLREIPKRELGHGEANATNAIMYIAPVGLLCACDPTRAALMAADVTAVNQHGSSRDVAAGYAAALSTCFVDDVAVESVIETAVTFTRDFRHVKEIRAMLDLAKDCRDCEEFIRRYYTDILGSLIPFQDLEHEGKMHWEVDRPTCVSWNSSEILGPVLGTFLITQGRNAADMILACAKIGRDADTIARCAGGLIGAYSGRSALPDAWCEFVLSRNRWLMLEDKALRLTDIVMRRIRNEGAFAQSILGESAAE